MVVQKTKQFAKICEKWKQKPAAERSTETQARSYFKDAYGMYDAERDLIHEIGVVNNAVMQEKMNKLIAENMQMKQDMAANQAKNEKYYHVIDTAMFRTQTTKEMERDDTTFDTQK